MTWTWLQRVRSPAAPSQALQQAPAPADAPPRQTWQDELLAEAAWSWEAARPDVGGCAGPWVAPVISLPRGFFTRHGYEPGERPPTIPALRALFETVYGGCVAPLPMQALQAGHLCQALTTWQAGDRDNHARAEVIFHELSALLGRAFAFEPAALAGIEFLTDALGFHEAGQVTLATRLLGCGAAELVNTIAHEQIHQLQWLQVDALQRSPNQLSHAERSLARYWSWQPTVSPKLSFMAYRLSGREVQANETGLRVQLALSQAFGWGAAAPIARQR